MKLESFMPEDLMVAYEECWKREHRYGQEDVNWGGWGDTPYLDHEEVMALYTYGPLAAELEKLLGEPAGVHLNLTGWLSTTRNWHQDSYLNPPHVGDYYAAVWIAFSDIHPDSGPFQYVPGSHRWPQVTREAILGALPQDKAESPRWPRYSEDILTPLFEQHIIDSESEVVTYLPSRGDVLIWHGRLLHRGSVPNTPGLERRMAIAHYSGINHRGDMPTARQLPGGGWYFPLREPAHELA